MAEFSKSAEETPPAPKASSREMASAAVLGDLVMEEGEEEEYSMFRRRLDVSFVL